MKSAAIIFAPAQYEAVLTYRIKGIPFFLFSAAKLAGIIGKENVIVATDSSFIDKLAQQYGFSSSEFPQEEEADIDILTKIKELFTEAKDCFITVYAGMPHLTEVSMLKGIEMIADNNDLVYTSTIMVEESDSIIFSKRFSGKESLLPLRFIRAKSIDSDRAENTTGIVLGPQEAQVYTRVDHLSRFSESEDCSTFFSGLSREILNLLHPHPIKMLLLDIDGVLTDGGMYYTESGDEFKKFDTKDGLAIKTLTKKGFNVGFISAGKNKSLIKSRAKLLGVQHCYVGLDPKLGILDAWLKDVDFGYENVLYVGDDLVDLDIFNAGVLSACPADAVKEIKEKAKIILTKKGGEGCVRELVDNYLSTFMIG
jgi:3-deoxy-D-manno-octulosonate 8-phosphate phosphatase (KDO 8-P phosphatase)